MRLVHFLAKLLPPKLVEGGLYHVPAESGGFTILKILKLDAEGVHVRVYSNSFVDPPRFVKESRLYLAGIDRRADERLGFGHLPLSKETFKSWNATFIQPSAVVEEELVGYHTWLEAKGGYF